MAGNHHNRAPTHTAYAYRREGRKSGRWLEIGVARAEAGENGIVRVFLDRLPIGGFSGGVMLTPCRPRRRSGRPRRLKPTRKNFSRRSRGYRGRAAAPW